MSITTTELIAQAYDQVRRMILKKELQPGEKIVQEKLAAQLGISRTPLRSALQLLEAENLVEGIPRRGMFVRKFSVAEIRDIYDCRVALECTATRVLAQRAPLETIQALEACFQPFFGATVVDEAAYQAADAHFHDLIVRGCGNPFLQRLFKQGNILACINMIGLVRPPSATLPEHRAIIDALYARDGELAEERMRDHLLVSQLLMSDD